MAVRIEFSTQAERELDEVIDYLLTVSTRSAEAFATSFERTIQRLYRFPNSGVQRPSGRRMTPVAGTDYLLFYRVTGHGLTVVSIRHGARKSP